MDGFVDKSLPSCLLLGQIDPLGQKLSEVWEMVRKAGLKVEGVELESCITRDKLARSLVSFGQHFQRHLPFIHSSTFDIGGAPPHLVLSMFCIGASYDRSITGSQQILKLAMLVLSEIEGQDVGYSGFFHH